MRVLETHLKGNLYLCTDGLERGVNILTEKPLLYLSLPLQYSSSRQRSSQHLAEKTTNLSHRELQILKQFPEYISRHHACILTIRLIELLHTCPQYSTIVKKYSPAKFTPEYQKEIQGIFLVVSSYYQNTPQITPSHDIYSCIDYVLRNTFTVTDFELNPHGVALYQHSSYFNHSCEPNLHHYFNLATHEIIIRTIRKILPGEELCISYIDTGQPTLYRRRELYEKYQFYCMCSKCCVEDPLDHWKCSQSQCTGSLGINSIYYQLRYKIWKSAPTPPLDAEEKIEWPVPSASSSPSTSTGYLPESSNLEWFYQLVLDSPHHFIENSLYFSCSACDYRYSVSHFIRLITQLNGKRSRTTSHLDQLVAFVNQHLPTSHYLYFDIQSTFILRLLQEQRYQEAVDSNISLLLSLYHNYGSPSRIIVIQLYQIVKLLLYLGQEHRAHQYLQWSLSMMNDLYGSSHETTQRMKICDL